MNVDDQEFLPLLEPFVGKTIVLADLGFRDQNGIPENLLCPKGTWNERMVVETALSMVTVVCGLKRLYHRTHSYLKTYLAFVAAMFNVLLELFRTLHPTANPFQLSIAEFSFMNWHQRLIKLSTSKVSLRRLKASCTPMAAKARPIKNSR